MKRTQFVLALSLAASMGSAVAAGPGYLGDLVGQSVSIDNTIYGAIGTPVSDVYSFDIGSSGASQAIATSVKVKLQFDGSTPIFDIADFAITLMDAYGHVYAADNTFDSYGALNLQADLAPSAIGSPGFYQFVVSGTTAGTSGGIYAGALSAAPVPEPSVWLTLLAGLGLIGLMVERTKRRTG